MNAINCYLPTDAEVEFYVYGGTNGGTYAFSIVNGDKLRHVGGDRLSEVAVAAGQTITVRARYEAVSASGSEGDIVAKAEFTEAETHRHLEDMHSGSRSGSRSSSFS